MTKKTTQRLRGKRDKQDKKPNKSGTDETPPLMNAAQLGARYKVSDETIRIWSKLAGFPAQALPGRWRVVEFDRAYVMMRDLGGPRGVTMAAAEGGHAGITGSVRPQAHPPEESDEAAIAASEETTPTELLKLSQQKLARSKTAEEIITRRLANQEQRRSLIRRAVVEETIFARAQSALAFARQLRLELPPKLLGLDRPEMEMKLDQAFEEFFKRVAALGDPLTAGKSKPDETPADDAKTKRGK